MGGVAMKELLHQIEERKQQGNWREYGVHNTGDPSLFPLPVRWASTEIGTTSSVTIGLPQIAKSVPPKQKNRWTPKVPLKCVAHDTVQIEDVPLQLKWNSIESMYTYVEKFSETDEDNSDIGGTTTEQRPPMGGKSIGTLQTVNSPKRPPLVSVSVESPGIEGPSHHPFGTCIDDIYGHSWSDKGGRWLWLPTTAGLNVDLGFTAATRDIRRFGHLAKKVVRTTPKFRDSRSFASVIQRSRNGP